MDRLDGKRKAEVDVMGIAWERRRCAGIKKGRLRFDVARNG